VRKIFDFGGHDVTVITYKERPVWVVSEIERALELAEDGLFKLLRRHAAEFPEGDFLIRLGPDESDFLRAQFAPSKSEGANKARHMLLFTEPGLYQAVMLTRSSKAIPFRQWLAKDVLPQLRATGRVELEPSTDLVLARDLAESQRRNIETQERHIAALEELALARQKMLEMQQVHHEREVAYLQTFKVKYELEKRPVVEKHQDVLEALGDAMMCTLSSRKLAQLLGVSHTYVDQYRKKYQLQRGERLTTERIKRINDSLLN
jgi:prophage antirepressor-like protein